MATVLAGFEHLTRCCQPDNITLGSFHDVIGGHAVVLLGLVERPAVDDAGNGATRIKSRRNQVAHASEIFGCEVSTL